VLKFWYGFQELLTMSRAVFVLELSSVCTCALCSVTHEIMASVLLLVKQLMS